MNSTSGFTYESPFIDLEIYRLVTVILASPAMAERGSDELTGRQWEWLRKIEFAEVSRLLVSIAAIVRTGLENVPMSYIELEVPVGILFPNRANLKRYEDLTLRKACNKILHATVVDPEVAEVRHGIAPALKPIVNLYGEHRGKEWRACLDVLRFAMAAVVNT